MNAPMSFGGGVYIADTSVWGRTGRERPFQDEWEQALEENRIAACSVTLMEMLHTARNAAEFAALEYEFSGLRMFPVGEREFALAVQAMRELAQVGAGKHRVKLPDALVAATATRNNVGVLHYDRHYDTLAEVLGFESRWVAPRGSMP
jgi:predicted nucleic acid-binding protein